MGKGKYLVFCLFVLLSTLLMGCGNNPVTKSQLENDLLVNVCGDDTIDFQIEKRDTTDKSDVIYCMIKYQVQNVERTEYYTMSYHDYSDGGWILEGVSPYDTELWSARPLEGLDAEYLAESILNDTDGALETDFLRGLNSMELPV